MALLILAPDRNTRKWKEELHRLDPDLEIRIWPECGDRKDIEFVLTWKHPEGELKTFPNLKCIASLGAGVDHILQDPTLPGNIPIMRVVDPLLTRSMGEYVVMMVLIYHRRYEQYRGHQQERRWIREPLKKYHEFTIGIMGLGKMGSSVARRLVSFGFQVAGWSRRKKSFAGIRSFWGDSQLFPFLQQSHILVCLLPLTPQTRNILNHHTFSQLPEGAYVINVARGEHLVEKDLLEALDSGHLAGACLDVFREEPLPETHPFWQHPKITITPHIASITSTRSVAGQIVENYHRMRTGKRLLNQVNVKRGY